MKLQHLFEMPQLHATELENDPTNPVEPMTAFFITDERLNERYIVLAEKDNIVAVIAKDKSTAMIGVRTTRHDGHSGVRIYGDLHFKGIPMLGTDAIDLLQLRNNNVLQVSLVTVVNNDKFRGLGSFLYSSLVQAGYSIISDHSHFIGGKELWKKLGRSHLPNEVVYIINRGEVLLDQTGKPVVYNGTNIPDNQIWSADEQHKFVLFVYKLR